METKYSPFNLTYPCSIDRIIQFDPGKQLIAIKVISFSDPCFQNYPLSTAEYPESKLIDSLSECAKLLLSKIAQEESKVVTLSRITSIEFVKPVRPGDSLRLEVVLQKNRKEIATLNIQALVDGKIVCQGRLTCTFSTSHSKATIHPTAWVHPSAILGPNVSVGPYSVIGEDVMIGNNTVIEAHVLIEKWTQIGTDCHLHFGSVIGSEAQDKKYEGEKTWVVLGDRNILREYVTINRATGKNTKTTIGSDNMFLTSVHIGHNCCLANNITIANTTQLGGHVSIQDNAVIGGMTGIHQYVRIGKGAMVGGYSRLPQDVAPFTLCEGNPAYVRGLNVIGLKRSGVKLAELKELKEAFKLLYRSNLNTQQAIKAIKENKFKSSSHKDFVTFIQSQSQRGLTLKFEKSSFSL